VLSATCVEDIARVWHFVHDLFIFFLPRRGGLGRRSRRNYRTPFSLGARNLHRNRRWNSLPHYIACCRPSQIVESQPGDSGLFACLYPRTSEVENRFPFGQVNTWSSESFLHSKPPRLRTLPPASEPSALYCSSSFREKDYPATRDLQHEKVLQLRHSEPQSVRSQYHRPQARLLQRGQQFAEGNVLDESGACCLRSFLGNVGTSATSRGRASKPILNARRRNAISRFIVAFIAWLCDGQLHSRSGLRS